MNEEYPGCPAMGGRRMAALREAVSAAVRFQTIIPHTRAVFERFSDVSDHRETGVWSRADLNPSVNPEIPSKMNSF